MPYNYFVNIANIPSKRNRIAIVDIGSNSLRLVVYHSPARVPIPVFNEKVQCQLGKGLDTTHKLNPDGVIAAFEALARFMKLAEVMKVDKIELLATAAVRESEDGPWFVSEIRRRFGANVQVLSGEEEAKLAAYGVLSGLPEADGLLGDMGGSSLDMVNLDHGQFGDHQTTPLGHLRLLEHCAGERDQALSWANEELDKIKWLEACATGRPFYAVGGAMRAIAFVFLHLTDYPLHIVDNFEVSAEDAEKHLAKIRKMSFDELDKVQGLSKKRLQALPIFATVLEAILAKAKPSKIIFSGFSMREGQFFLSLPDELRKLDPLISACVELVVREGRFGPQGEETYAWMNPLFANEEPHHQALRHAACLLNDIAWCEHPDYRAEHALFRVLRMPVAGLTHHDRALLAACVFSRYKGNFSAPYAAVLRSLLVEQDEKWTKTVGAALRLAHTLASGTPHLLDETTLEPDFEKGELTLKLPYLREIFRGEAVEKRHGDLAKQLGLTPIVFYHHD